MKFQFDPNQQYQLDAISAMTDLFKGHIISYRTFGVAGEKIGSLPELSLSKGGLEALYGNKLTLNNEQMNDNLKAIQNKNQIISSESINTGSIP